MIQPLNDLVIAVPVDLDLMKLPDSEGFGLKASKNSVSEEALRWRVIAAGPGVFTNTGSLIPNPVKVGDVIIIGGCSNLTFRESYAKSSMLIEGQKIIAHRSLDPASLMMIVTNG
jgi:co-chaperonin GroES (HSP10)